MCVLPKPVYASQVLPKSHHSILSGCLWKISFHSVPVAIFEAIQGSQRLVDCYRCQDARLSQCTLLTTRKSLIFPPLTGISACLVTATLITLPKNTASPVALPLFRLYLCLSYLSFA